MKRNVFATPGYLTTAAARGFARLSEARLKPLGFGVGAVPVLVALRDAGVDTQAELARTLRIGQPPMAQMLARMERDGLIERCPDPSDGRSRKIALTARAEAGLPGALAALFEGNEEAMRGFTDEEAAVLATLLERVIANLNAVGGGPD